MSETYPKKDPLRNAFRRTYFPSSVGFDCKDSELFWIEQIKIAFLLFLEA